jgi:hypothetical protein
MAGGVGELENLRLSGLTPSCLSWLTVDWALAQFAGEADTAVERYQTFVADGLVLGDVVS